MNGLLACAIVLPLAGHAHTPPKKADSPSTLSLQAAEARMQAEPQAPGSAGGHVYLEGDGLIGTGPVLVTALIDRSDPASRAEIPYLADMVARSPKVTVDIKELPLLDRNSVELSRRLVAIRLHGGMRMWEEMEYAIARTTLPVTPERMDAQAEKLGLHNLAGLAHEKDVTDYLMDVRRFAIGLSIHSTPVIMVGDQLRLGLQTTDMLLKTLTKARMPGE
ncbi:DsbA family protein [Gluconobacter cerinus]